MRLLLVELNRFRSRRAIALMLLGVILLVGWMTIDTIWQSRPASSTQVAAAKESAAEDAAQAQQDYERCVADPAGYFGGGDLTAEDCQTYEPDYRDYLTHRPLDMNEELTDTGKAALIVLSGLAVIIGATFAGADWSSGSMSNQVLFRPRRVPVWLAKAAAVVVGVTAVAAVLVAAQWAAYYAVNESRGVPVPDGFTSDLLRTTGRGLALTAAGALGGYSLTMLLRSTVGVLSLLFFYAVAGEILVSNLPFEKVSQWSLANNIFAWLDDGTRVYDLSLPCPPGAGGCDQYYTLSLEHGGVYLGALLLLALIPSLVLFRRRDIP